MADEWGTTIYLPANTAPRWDQAELFRTAWNELVDDDDEDASIALVDRFVPQEAGFVDLAEMMFTGAISDREFNRLRDCVVSALASENEFVLCRTVGLYCMLEAAPETGASELLEAGWQNGLLGAAGFLLEAPAKLTNVNSALGSA